MKQLKNQKGFWSITNLDVAKFLIVVGFIGWAIIELIIFLIVHINLSFV